MIEIEFAKYHGLGNDFVIVEDMERSTLLGPVQIQAMCDRHTGIGADGLLLVRPSEVADFAMVYHNADGGEAEMCGNGIRCFARYLLDYRLSAKASLAIQTKAGVRRVEAHLEDGVVASVTVDMGSPRFAPPDVPVRAGDSEAVGVPLPTSRGDVYATCLSMGNPHCVLFGPDVSRAPVATLGPELEKSPVFPEGANIEFVQVLSADRLRIRVWERGVGETLACGTGACAAAVASARTGKTNRIVEVELPGGILTVEWRESGAVFMTGPAEHVFSGTYFLRS